MKKIPLYLSIPTFFVLLVGFAMADVINGSEEPVYVKKEDGADLVEVKPGGVYKGEHDGVVAGGRVTKNSDGIDLIVEKGGNVRVRNINLVARAVEGVRAGELEKSPDGTWDPAFEKAAEQLKAREEAERARQRAEAERVAREQQAARETRERADRERERERAERERHRETVERHGFDRDYNSRRAERDAWETPCRRC